MTAKNSNLDEVRRKKRRVGAIAIVFLLWFTVLAIIGFISIFVWIVADLVVALIANLILRKISTQEK